LILINYRLRKKYLEVKDKADAWHKDGFILSWSEIFSESGDIALGFNSCEKGVCDYWYL